MTDLIIYSRMNSPFGPVYVAKTRKGVCLVNLSNISEDGFADLIRKKFQKDITRNDNDLQITINELSAYFSGSQVKYKTLIDLSKGTVFQRMVWNKVSEIPYGELRTYKWIACEIGNASAVRAVGNAVGKNPVPPIVPCHRVIRSDGSLGGFSSGISLKKWLLNLES